MTHVCVNKNPSSQPRNGTTVSEEVWWSWENKHPSEDRNLLCIIRSKHFISAPHLRMEIIRWFGIGIDQDTVCAGVVGTAIRHSTNCADRRAAACGRAIRHNECCTGLQYQARQYKPYKWSISILPRSQFYKKQVTFSTSCTAVRPHRGLRIDAWRRES